MGVDVRFEGPLLPFMLLENGVHFTGRCVTSRTGFYITKARQIDKSLRDQARRHHLAER